MREVPSIQAQVLRLRAQIAHIRLDLIDLVAELNRDHLPRGAEYDRMGEDEETPSVAYYLAGLLAVVESDDLSRVENDLSDGATITAADLEREFARRGTTTPPASLSE